MPHRDRDGTSHQARPAGRLDQLWPTPRLVELRNEDSIELLGLKRNRVRDGGDGSAPPHGGGVVCALLSGRMNE